MKFYQTYKKSLFYLLLFIVVIALAYFYKADNFIYSPDKTFLESIIVEAHGIIGDLLVFGFIISIWEARREMKANIFLYQDNISVHKTVKSNKTSQRIVAQNITYLNRLGVINIDISECKFPKWSKFTELKFGPQSNFDESKLNETEFEGCKFIGCDFGSKNQKDKPTFFNDSFFGNCIFENCQFDQTDLSECSFLDCQIKRCDFSDSKLINTIFTVEAEDEERAIKRMKKAMGNSYTWVESNYLMNYTKEESGYRLAIRKKPNHVVELKWENNPTQEITKDMILKRILSKKNSK